MVFGFDPRKLVEEDQEDKKKEVKEAVDSVLTFEENAEKKVVDLKAEGYPAALVQINPEGLYRVAYGRYTSKKEAINMLYFLKYTLEEEAWYLEEHRNIE